MIISGLKFSLILYRNLSRIFYNVLYFEDDQYVPDKRSRFIILLQMAFQNPRGVSIKISDRAKKKTSTYMLQSFHGPCINILLPPF
jgi:hypothetical protein